MQTHIELSCQVLSEFQVMAKSASKRASRLILGMGVFLLSCWSSVYGDDQLSKIAIPNLIPFKIIKATSPWQSPVRKVGAFAAAIPETPSDLTSTGLATTSLVVNSVSLVTGNVTKAERDFATKQLYPVELVRTYNHFYTGQGIFGPNWVSNFDASLSFKLTNGTSCSAVPGETSSCISPSTPNSSIAAVIAVRSDGTQATYIYTASRNAFISQSPDASDWITHNADGSWTQTTYGASSAQYTFSGFLVSMSDSMGIGWTLAYSANFLQSATHTSGLSINFGWSNGRVSSVTDPAGSAYSYYYSNSANPILIQVNCPNGDTRKYNYGGPNNGLTNILYNNSNYVTFTYNADGTAATSGMVDGSQQKISITYNGNNSVTLTNASGAVATIYYSVIQNQYKLTQTTISGVSNQSAAASYIYYDSAGHPTYSFDRNGNKTTYSFTNNGFLTDIVTGISTTNPNQQRETQYTYDSLYRIINVKTLGPGSIQIANVAYTYSSSNRNRLTSVVVTNLSANGAPNQTQTTTYSYQFYANNIPSQIIVNGPLAPAGGYMIYNFDSFGNVTSTADALGHATTFGSYNGLGLPASVADANGYSQAFSYDLLGNATAISETIGGVQATTSYQYDRYGHPYVVTFPDGGTYTLGLDQTRAGRITSIFNNIVQNTVIDGYTYTLTASNQLTYSALGVETFENLQTVAIPSGNRCGPNQIHPTHCSNISSYFYSHNYNQDQLGRTTSDIGAYTGEINSYTYDVNNNLTSVQDALGNVSHYAYDSHNEIQTATDQLGNITRYTYDGAGNVASVTDPKNNVTSYSWDGFRQLTAMTSPDSHTTSFAYDAQGRLSQITRADGTVESYFYDSMNRIIRIVAGSLTKSITYDTCTNGLTRICGISDPSGSAVYTYRQNGQIASQTTTIGSTPYLTSWSYDNRDRVAGIIYPSGDSVSYTYNGQSEVTSVTATVGGVANNVANNIGYMGTGLGPIIGMNMGDGSAVTWTYDYDLAVTSLTANAASSLQSIAYSYDLDKRISGITNNLNTSNNEALTYNALDQLTGVTSSGLGNQSISLDGNGTRSSATWGGVTDTYTPESGSNRIASISGSRARSFTYDLLGNMKSASGWNGTRTYSYDSFNRLNQLVNAGASTTYAYNALGQRVQKAGASGNYKYVYTPDGYLLGETANGGTALSTEYIWLGVLPLAVLRNGALYFVHSDHLGRPDTVTNSGATIVWQAANTPFDRTVTTNTFGGLNLGLPGQYFDAESGMYYNMFRNYDPTLGGYIQSDPIGLAGGLNTYSYAENNPISIVDPLGLAPQVSVSVPPGAAGGRFDIWQPEQPGFFPALVQYVTGKLGIAPIIYGLIVNVTLPDGSTIQLENVAPYAMTGLNLQYVMGSHKAKDGTPLDDPKPDDLKTLLGGLLGDFVGGTIGGGTVVNAPIPNVTVGTVGPADGTSGTGESGSQPIPGGGKSDEEDQ